MTTRHLFACFLLLLPGLGWTQPNCRDMIAEGNRLAAVASPDWEKVLTEYLSALNCDAALASELGPKIQGVFVKIEAQKQEAISQRQRAEQQTRVAIQERDRANQRAREAKASELAAKALQINTEDNTLALNLAMEGYQLEPLEQVTSALNEVLSKEQSIYYSEVLPHADTVVSAVTYSPASDKLYVGMGNGEITRWDVAAGTKQKLPSRHTAAVNYIVFSPGGRYYATGSDDNTVTVWDARRDTYQYQLFVNPLDTKQCLVFSPDGTRLLTGSKNKGIQIWNVQTGMLQDSIDLPRTEKWNAYLKDYDPEEFFVALASDGKRYLTTVPDEEKVKIRVRDTYTGGLIDSIENINVDFYVDEYFSSVGLVFSPYSNYFLSIDLHDGTIRIWDQLVSEPADRSPTSTSARPKQYIVTRDENGKHIWNMGASVTVGTHGIPMTGKDGILATSIGSELSVDSLQIGIDGTISLIRNGIATRLENQEIETVTFFNHTREGRLVTYSQDGKAYVWDPGYGTLSDSLRLGLNQTNYLYLTRTAVVSPDWNYLVLGKWFTGIHVWDLFGNRSIAEQGDYDGMEFTAGTFAPDQRRFLTGFEDGDVKCWYLPQFLGPERLERLSGKTGSLAAGMSSNGRFIAAVMPETSPNAAAAKTDTLVVWDFSAGEVHAEIPGFSLLTDGFSGSRVLKVSPDGRYAITGPTPTLWDLATGGSTAFQDGVFIKTDRAVAFSPVAPYIGLTAQRGDRIALLNIATNKVEHWLAIPDTSSFNPINPLIQTLAFSPNGRLIAAGTRTGQIRVWETATGRPRYTFKADERMINTLTFTPDGTKLVTGSHSGNVKHWNATTGSYLSTLVAGNGPISSIRSLSISEDGHYYLVGQKLYDAVTGANLVFFPLFEETDFDQLVLTPDSRYVLTTTDNKRVAQLWSNPLALWQNDDIYKMNAAERKEFRIDREEPSTRQSAGASSPTPASPPPGNEKYAIQVGSFQTIQADIMLAKMIELGYPDAYISEYTNELGNTFRRVIAAVYTDRAAAHRELARMKREYDLKDGMVRTLENE